MTVLRLIRRVNHTTERLDTERQRRYVKKKHLAVFTSEHAALDRRTDCDGFIRIDALGRLAAKDLSHGLNHLRDSGHATNKDNFLDVGRLQVRVFESQLARLDGLLDQFIHERLKLGT